MKYSPKYFKENLPAAKNRRSSFLVRHFYRPLSFYFSSLAYVCGLTANRVSFLGTLIAYASAVCFLINSDIVHYIGILLTILWMISDCVDGNLARCVGKQPYGEFVDAVGSYTIVGIMFPAIAFAAYNGNSIWFNENPWIIVIGAFASIADTMARLYFLKFRNEQLEEQQNNKADGTDSESMGRLRKIYERMAKEVGISGLMIPFLIVATILRVLDIFVIFYFLFFMANYVASFFVLIKNSKCLSK